MVGVTLALKTAQELPSGAATREAAAMTRAAGSMPAMTSDKGGDRDGDDNDTNLFEDTERRRTACRSWMAWPAAARGNGFNSSDFNLCDMATGRSGPKAEAEPIGAHPTTRSRKPMAMVFIANNVSNYMDGIDMCCSRY